MSQNSFKLFWEFKVERDRLSVGKAAVNYLCSVHPSSNKKLDVIFSVL